MPAWLGKASDSVVAVRLSVMLLGESTLGPT
jgi:hypothetical protein